MSYISKSIYVLLLLLLILHPHLITGRIFNVPPAYAQSLTSLLLTGLAYIVYLLHERDVQKKEEEKKNLEHQFNRKLNDSKKHLTDAFKYIGLINRRLPLLPQLTSNLLKKSKKDKRSKKTIFQELLATAITSIAKNEWGAFRFIDIRTLKTVKEFTYINHGNKTKPLKLSNKDIMHAASQKASIKNLNENISLISTSDQISNVQCFLYFEGQRTSLIEEYPVLQSIVDQAQLFYMYLYPQTKRKTIQQWLQRDQKSTVKKMQPS